MLSDTVADQVQHFRKERGLSRTQLAARCSDLGWPHLTEPALANLEGGRRNADKVRTRQVTIDELVVLAAALDVAPVQLVLPLGTAPAVEIIPGLDVPVDRALEWVTTGQRLLLNDPRGTSPGGADSARSLIVRVDRHAGLTRWVAEALPNDIRQERDEVMHAELVAMQDKARQELLELREAMEVAEQVPPALPNWHLGPVDRPVGGGHDAASAAR